ncbi:MAG: uroporphyrinogen decarboxylase family protein [Candidatus Sumerlaeia bacterium]
MQKLPKREPDYNNIMKVLKREAPDRPTLYEFFTNVNLMRPFMEAEGSWLSDDAPFGGQRNYMKAYARGGYDYATIPVWDYNLLGFKAGERKKERTISLNDGAVISDEASLEAYAWPEADEAQYEQLGEIGPYVPEGMCLMVVAPGGILENMIRLAGYENLCIMLAMEPHVVERMAREIGDRMLRHYELALEHDFIKLAVLNDDWGFKTQTMLSTEDMRKYVFPQHKRIVEAIHAAGRPAILHSCGQMVEVWDDIIDDIGYDGKHSYEDNIIPVEESYDRWGDRIAILGGIDMDFLARETPEAVYKRSRAMLERAQNKGGYALGSGNSIPDYIPAENYYAMLRAALEA